jgi:hypothetical protein
MATDPPQPSRWHKRGTLLMELGRRPQVRDMMGMLGYSLDSLTWL